MRFAKQGHSATASPTKRMGDRFLPRRDGF